MQTKLQTIAEQGMEIKAQAHEPLCPNAIYLKKIASQPLYGSLCSYHQTVSTHLRSFEVHGTVSQFSGQEMKQESVLGSNHI